MRQVNRSERFLAACGVAGIPRDRPGFVAYSSVPGDFTPALLTRGAMTEPHSFESSPRSRSNRRTSPRRLPRGSSKAICRKGTLGLGPNLALSLIDLSETGVQLLLREPLPAGQEVEVCLLAPGSPRKVKLTGRVVWSAPAANNSCWVGIRFDKFLSYSAVQEISRIPGM